MPSRLSLRLRAPIPIQQQPSICACCCAKTTGTVATVRTAAARRGGHKGQGVVWSSSLAPASKPIPQPASVATTVPSQWKSLYGALAAVQDGAGASFVNVSRLQLARRGLEGEQPVIRVAMLGLDGSATAARLAKLLLADPLADEDYWKGIEEVDATNGVLIRYGETVDVDTVASGPLPTITVPSRLLQKANMELLVSSLPSASVKPGVFDTESMLVPTIGIQSTVSGARTFVRYPVHRTLVCGEGMDAVLAYSKLMATTDGPDANANMIRAVFDMDVELGEQDAARNIQLVNTKRANQALDAFRQSVKNAPTYERGWTASGVQPLINWLLKVPDGKGPRERLNPAVRDLVDSLVVHAERAVDATSVRLMAEARKATVPAAVRADLSMAVDAWAEQAHAELRDGLAVAFGGPGWGKGLAWWRLLWRVDDVGVAAAGIVGGKWLVEAERKALWLGGRFEQAGLLERGREHEPEVALGAGVEADSAVDPDADAGTDTKLAATAAAADTTNSHWPTRIAADRARLSSTTVPALQRLAQTVLFSSLSTTGLTSALAALTFVSLSTPSPTSADAITSPTTSTTTSTLTTAATSTAAAAAATSPLSSSLYQAGVIAAAGLLYSAHRQQQQWETARTRWERDVQEQGRVVLREVEAAMRQMLERGGAEGCLGEVEAEELERVEGVRGLLGEVRRAIEKVD